MYFQWRHQQSGLSPGTVLKIWTDVVPLHSPGWRQVAYGDGLIKETGSIEDVASEITLVELTFIKTHLWKKEWSSRR